MRGILACALVATVLASPAGLKADDTPVASPEPAPPTAGTTTVAAPEQTTAPPLLLKHSRIYLDRKTPVAADGAAPAPPLDLEIRPEDIERMMTRIQYNPDPQEPDTVEVTGELDTSGPRIPGGPFALYWALKNPKQAWRIFTPVQ